MGEPPRTQSSPPGPNPARPTPVRQSLDRSNGEAPSPEAETRIVQALGATWTAEVIGRATAGTSSEGVPLIELALSAEDGRRRRVLLVGTDLGNLVESVLVRALTEAEDEPDIA